MALDMEALAGFSTGLNEDGSLEFIATPSEAGAEGEAKGTEDKGATPEATGTKVGVDGQDGSDKAATSTQSPAPVDWEKRYKDLQADHTRKSQELSNLHGKVDTLMKLVESGTIAGKQTPSEQSDEDLLDALADRDKAPGVLKDLIKKGVEQALSQTPEAKVQREFEETAMRIGQPFIDQLPVITRLSSELAPLKVNFSFDQLYALATLVPREEKKAEPGKPEAAASKPQVEPKTMSTDEAAAVKAKAVGLQTESGISANPDVKKPVNSVKSALNAALEELGYA